MTKRTRREFLEQSMLAAAAVTAGSATRVLAEEKKPDSNSPNETLRVAIIGVRGRGTSHIKGFAGRDGVEVTHICDADTRVADSRVKMVAERQSREPKFVQDMREIFDDKSVDIVTTATPNHWHALCSIWAMQAGKDVYVEKPVSHNVSEGRRIVEAARKYDRICQTGTQSRSNSGMREAIDYIHSGKLGDVKLTRGLCYKRRRSIGPKGEYDIPDTIDYSLWSGPAEIKPLTRRSLHYDWHWMWDYGNGDLGNQGIHQMDICRWGLGVDQLSYGVVSYGGRLGYEDAGETANTQVSILDYGDKQLVFEVRGLETEPYKGAGVGCIFYGTEGYMVMPSYNRGVLFDLDGNEVKRFDGGGDHYGNFIQAVRSRKHEDLNADILDGHLSSALCHLGNVSYRLGENVDGEEAKSRLPDKPDAQETFERFEAHLAANDIKLSDTKIRFGRSLTFEPTSETFPSDPEANRLLTREYRAPFIVPGAGEV